MLRTIFTFLFLQILILGFAQQDVLEFKGIPIQGRLDTFVSQLEKKGYEKYYENDYAVILNGDFTSKSVKVFVLSSRNTHTVWKVVVKFPEVNSWTSLKSQYRDMVDLYKQKYSVDQSYEFFSSPYYEGDGYELSAFKHDKGNYITFFKEGVIVEINDDAALQVSYENKENAKIANSEKESNNLEDI